MLSKLNNTNQQEQNSFFKKDLRSNLWVIVCVFAKCRTPVPLHRQHRNMQVDLLASLCEVLGGWQISYTLLLCLFQSSKDCQGHVLLFWEIKCTGSFSTSKQILIVLFDFQIKNKMKISIRYFSLKKKTLAATQTWF